MQDKDHRDTGALAASGARWEASLTGRSVRAAEDYGVGPSLVLQWWTDGTLQGLEYRGLTAASQFSDACFHVSQAYSEIVPESLLTCRSRQQF